MEEPLLPDSSVGASAGHSALVSRENLMVGADLWCFQPPLATFDL